MCQKMFAWSTVVERFVLIREMLQISTDHNSATMLMMSSTMRRHVAKDADMWCCHEFNVTLRFERECH
jgi:hypothetical protein